MSIDPGLYRTKLTLQQASSTTDSIGQPIATWSDVATVWARVEPLSGKEQYWAMQVHASVSHKVTCRYNAAIVPTGRLVIYGTNRILNITSVADFDERRVEMTIMATEANPSEA